MTEQELMLTSILKCQRIDLYKNPSYKKDHPESILDPKEVIIYNKMLNERSAGRPIQYCIGSCNFFGLDFFVDERVLIPRPETEILVETAIELIKNKFDDKSLKALDIGTGSGCIAITILKKLKNIDMVAIDKSEDALCVASINAKEHGVTDRIVFECKDILSYFNENNSKKFDIIISNPPYIRSGDMKDLPIEVLKEPISALDGGEDGLDFYRIIIDNIGSHLTDGGLLIFEIGDDQFNSIEKLLKNTQYFKKIDFKVDYTNTKRIIFAFKNI